MGRSRRPQVGADVEPVGVFADAFLEQIPRDVIIDAVEDVVAETGGLRLERVTKPGEFELQAMARALRDGACWRIEVRVQHDAPHKITRLYYVADPVLGVRHGDGWPELERLLAALPGTVALGTYAVYDGALAPIHLMNDNKVLAVGSVFKLWVLGALGERIAAGKASWDEQLSIRDAYKSLPSGTMQNLADGERRSLREFALKMISISDNTATDHLMHYLGRDTVERFAVAHGSPGERNRPLLTTREFFKLKTVADAELRKQYIAADADERARLLQEPVAKLPLPLDSQESDTPLAIEEIEYFAAADAIATTIGRSSRHEQGARARADHGHHDRQPGHRVGHGAVA